MTDPAKATARPPARLKPRRWLLWNRPKGTTGTWTVHATVDEPTELLCAFVAHYKALGATEIWLALDNPRPAQVAILQQIPGVRLTLCNAAYWLKTRGKRPELHVKRQGVNATRAYRKARTDWFLECDADEFLLPRGMLSDQLKSVPADTLFLRFPMAERVFERARAPGSIFDGQFRSTLRHRPGLITRLYGDLAPMVPSGMTGHTFGKSITRTGLNAWIWVHNPLPPMTRGSDPHVRAMVQAAGFTDLGRMLHFDGLTPFHWRLKLMRKMLVGQTEVEQALKHNSSKRGAGRQAQIAALFAARTDADGMAALDGLQILDDRTIAQLREAGTILADAPDITAQAQALFAGTPLDFSVTHFDAQLHRLYADQIARLGLVPTTAWDENGR